MPATALNSYKGFDELLTLVDKKAPEIDSVEIAGEYDSSRFNVIFTAKRLA